MCDDHYLPNEFNYIIYQASSGGLSVPESDARISYYAISGFPTLKFDGNWDTQVGAAEAHADGTFYQGIIDNHRATEAPLAVIVQDYSFDAGSAFVTVKVKMFADIPTAANHKIRIAIVESDLSYGGTIYQGTLRDMVPSDTGVDLTVTQNGEEQIVTFPITMNGTWNPANLFIIGFVQNDGNKYIVNSGNSEAGEFAGVVGVNGPRQVIADGAQVTFGDANLLNIGFNNDTFDVSIDTSQLPDGWAAHLAYDGSDYQTFSVNLDPYEAANFNVVMDTGTVGSGHVLVDIYSQGGGNVVETLEFVALAGGTDLLVVADDGLGAAVDYYAPAIDPSEKTYAIWDRGLAAVAGDDLLAYEGVIWETGGNTQCLPEEDRLAINDYLAAGGNLILAGEDLLESLYVQGGSARLWYQLKLRIGYASDNSNNLVINGQPGTVGDGLSFTLNGGDPDLISLLSGQEAYVTEAFRYGNDSPAGIQTEYSTYKVLTLPWGLERVPAEADRIAIINNALDWMGLLDPLAADDVPLAGAVLLQNAPNPFNPMTKISLVMDQTGPAKLEIFNARGQLVRVLVDGTLAVGDHAIVWDGKSDGGQQAASGTYFYRLSTHGDQLTKKMSLVK